MIEMEQKVAELSMSGLCCAQVVLQIVGLEVQEQKNDQLIKAVRGLCYGMQDQYLCGSLSGGICGLSLYDFTAEDLHDVCEELIAWFEESFGGVNCSDLIGRGGDPAPICRDSMVQVCQKCFDILEDYEFI